MRVIYSPSQTTTWLQCPVKRRLRYRDRILPRQLGWKEYTGALSHLVHSGLAAHYAGLSEPDYAALFATQKAEWARQSRTVHEKDARSLQLGADMVEVAGWIVKNYKKSDPIQKQGWTVISVEQELPSGSRPDMVVDSGRGPCPLDFKLKYTLDPKWEDKEILRYAHSWQMHHYGYEIGSPLYWILLLAIKPTWRIRLIPYEISASFSQDWILGAARVWTEMEKEDVLESPPWMASTHVDEYGQCEYYRWCFEGNRQDYVQGE